MTNPPKYWFPAKRYGWGWGLPAAWQGWIVIAVYLGLLLELCDTVSPRDQTVKFILLFALLNVALVTICWIKGEPPRWRWGK